MHYLFLFCLLGIFCWVFRKPAPAAAAIAHPEGRAPSARPRAHRRTVRPARPAVRATAR